MSPALIRLVSPILPRRHVSLPLLVSFLFLLFLSLGAPLHALAAPGPAGAGNWFVRPDGGDRKQCTGRVDAPYRGHGGNQPCAFKHPQNLFSSGETNNRAWIIAGGDTVLIRGGPYRMGYTGPNPNDQPGLCQGDPYGCTMPPVPSGSADHPTRILGEHNNGCSAKTQIFGGYALGVVISLSGSKHVDLECIELTDHAQCTRVAAGTPGVDSCSSSYPLSDYASVGIATNPETADITLKNLDIHGFAARGIIGAIGGDIVVDHVRIAFNGGAGWDFDDGKGTPSTASAFVHASFLTVEWNGCNEEYPIVHPIPASSCFDQDHAGYGDGIGTPGTPLSFFCDHCLFRYNTQDGFDLLHTTGSAILITNSRSVGNMGQQWKMGAMHSVLFRNNITVHNCSRLSAPMAGVPDGYNKNLSLFCRAAGDGITFAVADGGSYVLENNTYVGYGTTSYDISCAGSCPRPNIVFRNNLHVGYKNPRDGQPPAVFYTTDMPKDPFLARSHNVYFHMRSCPTGTAESCADPRLAGLPAWTGESSLDNLNFLLSDSSPARGAGVPIEGLTTDHDGLPRGARPDIGAFQYRP